MHTMAKYCIECGHGLSDFDENGTMRLRCDKCGWIHYLNPYPAAAALVVKGDEVLLVKRGVEPRIGLWCLPSGFEEYDEPPETTAVRETKEETGLDIELVDLFDVCFVSETSKHCILVIYTAVPTGEAVTDDDLQPGDDVTDARFCRFDEMPEDIAFDSHRKAIERFRREQKARGKLTDV